jgi:hypothetical protein
VNPEALEEAGERFEERLDCVIVLRPLSKEEIEKLADRTKEIREEREDSETERDAVAIGTPPKIEQLASTQIPTDDDIQAEIDINPTSNTVMSRNPRELFEKVEGQLPSAANLSNQITSLIQNGWVTRNNVSRSLTSRYSQSQEALTNLR